MSNITQMTNKQRNRPSAALTPQQMATDLPKVVKALQKQNISLQRLIQEQAEVSKMQLEATKGQMQVLDRIHDRLDTLAIESRVTNLLLSEMVAIHQTVINNDTDEKRENIRADAYNRILNAE